MKTLALCLALVGAAAAQQLPNADLLNQPPRPATATDCPKVDEWSMPAEKSCYRNTPRYEETMAYANRVASAAPRQVKIEKFGKTGQGRDLVAIILSKDGIFDPAALHKANRPVVYIQNAIHAGEMDGKDASLALIRDIVVSKTRSALIDRAVLVIIPIYNADGHEFFGPYNRINQNGPEQMGWRTNARQLNLNRDYMKADAPETRAFLQLWNRWLPDFFIDDHVTDGADYQYDVTYFLDNDPTTYAPLASWINGTVAPELEKKVTAAGHLISPYIDFGGATPDTGLTIQQSIPRFATAYVNLQNRPSLLIEMHMLKDYRTRVTGNYEALRAVLEIVNREADKIVQLNRAADVATIAAGREHHSEIPIAMEPSGQTESFHYKGYKWTVEKSEVSGGQWIRYTHEPVEMDIPRQVGLKSVRSAAVPAAYIVPAEWTPVIDVLTAHGLQLRRTSAPWTGEIESYRCEAPQWAQQPFEAHHLASWPNKSGTNRPACRVVREKLSFPAGSVVVPMDQRAAKIAMHFLEPEAPDSAVVWGYFDTVFEQKEYGESYVLEKLAREMLERDPKLKAEYDERVATDPKFSNPYARLNWFYQHSPWWDDRVGLVPVGKLQSVEGIPLSK